VQCKLYEPFHERLGDGAAQCVYALPARGRAA
jgi:hypothetical protein